MRELLQKRASKLKEANELVDKAANEKRDLSVSEESKFTGLLNEINGIDEQVNERLIAIGEAPIPYRATRANIKGLLADLEKPMNAGTRNNPMGIIENPNEIRAYNKAALPEFRSAIQSMDKLGIDEPVSAGKFIRSLITGDWRNSPNERRALGTATQGGSYLIPELVSSSILELALNKTQVMAAGASVLIMDSKTLTVPKVLTMPEASFKAENAAWGGNMDALTFDGVTLTAKTIMSAVSCSIELAQDGINMESTIENEISRAIALEIDRACLLGNGTTEPLGIRDTPLVLMENLPSPIVSYAPFSNAFYKIEAQNGTVNSMIAASSIFGELDLLVGTVEFQPVLPPQSWSKYKQYSSNQLTAQAIMGDFTKLLIGMRSTINLEITRTTETAFKNAQVWVRGIVRMDCAIANPKHFCVIELGGSGSFSPSSSESPSESPSVSPSE